MEQSQRNKSFSAADIERYHGGQMKPEERHALEKAALDDPFLADALEGYQFTNTASSDLQHIETRLKERTRRKKIIPFFFTNNWVKIAAVLMLIAGAGWLMLRTKDLSPEKQTVAVQPVQEKKEVPSSPEGKTDTTNFSDSYATEAAVEKDMARTADAKQEIKKNKELKVSISLSQQNSRSERPDSNQQASSLTNNSAKNFTTNVNAPASQNNYRYSPPSFNNAQMNGGSYNNMNATRPAPSDYVIANPELRRQVVNNAVESKDRDSGIRTTDIAYHSNAEGFYKTTIGINSDSVKNFNVTLKEEPLPANEVVVTSQGRKKTNARMPIVIVDTLEPTGGFAQFDDYVVNNLKQPVEMKLKPFTGEVQLSFDVNSNGEPVNIAVIKSLCAGCDEEAIRLLKEGPKWKTKKNKKGKVTIKF